MREETDEQARPLRTGFTTGACATATSLAAARLLLAGELTHCVSIDLPKGQRVEFALQYCRQHNQYAEAGIIKDAGDDPDVTHGALICARVSLSREPGVVFHAGPGIGTVTREGLALAVGEPAINPVPRRMINQHLQALATEHQYHGGFDVTLSIPDGEQLAEKTMNPRLGIVGGLSVLGTTGIVRPFSCAAYIASIHQGIDVAIANGHHMLAASTGNMSEQAISQIYQLPPMALLEMGDFAGAVLKYLRRISRKTSSIDTLVIAGGFGKLSKLADGHLDLHSRKSTINFTFLADAAAGLGALPELQQQIRNANTSIQALQLCQQAGLPLGDHVCERARQVCQDILPASIEVEIWAFDKQGQKVGCSRK